MILSYVPKVWQYIAIGSVASVALASWIIIFCLVALIGYGLLEESQSADTDEQYTEEFSFGDEDCNVAGLELHGVLLTYISPSPSSDSSDEAGDYMAATASEDLVYAIEQLNQDEEVKAILMEIDSPGGLPVAAEEVTKALQASSKPTVALIREMGLSGAYWVATGADKIFASANSDVGSIGVTMSYLDNTTKNKLDGLTYIELTSGKFKDMLNPDRPLTEEERVLLQRDLDIIHQNFISTVSTNRNISLEKVQSLADGSSMLGQMAKDNGLVDEIGGLTEVRNYLTEVIGQEAKVCF